MSGRYVALRFRLMARGLGGGQVEAEVEVEVEEAHTDTSCGAIRTACAPRIVVVELNRQPVDPDR